MRWFKAALVASISAVLPAVAMADPFNAKQVPADAKWLMHVDVDAARGTKMWDILSRKLAQDPNYGQKVDEAARITGMHFPEDVHDVTLFGKSAAEDAGAVILHGKMDRDKTTMALQFNPAYASQSYGNYQIMSWDDKGTKNFGAFHDGDLAVIGRSAAMVENALDTLDGKGESLKSDSALAGGASGSALVYVAARDLASLKKDNQPQSPLVQQVDTAWISLGEKDNSALLRASVTALTPETAEQMQSALDGIRAMVSLAANGQNADAKAKNAAAGLASLTITRQDRTMQLQWPVSLDIIKDLLEKK